MRSIERFAKSAGYQVADWFNDPAVSRADPIESRPSFAALLNRIDGNGVRVVLVQMRPALPAIDGPRTRHRRPNQAWHAGDNGQWR